MEARSSTRCLYYRTMQRDGLMENGRKKLTCVHALRSCCIPKINRATTGKKQYNIDYINIVHDKEVSVIYTSLRTQ